MNPIIQSARAHYATLPPHVKERATAKHLLAVIQMAEALESAMSGYQRWQQEVSELEKNIVGKVIT